MNNIKLPNIFNRISTNLVSDHEATMQNLKMLLLSEKGELFGDPYYGTGLKKYMFDQNDAVLQDILIDDVYTAISLFIPQLKVDRKDITFTKNDNGQLSVSIKAINRLDFTTDLYNIVLLEAEV